MVLLEKLLTYTFELYFLASENCFKLSLSVSRAARSYSEDFLVHLLAFCFLMELGTSSHTSLWMIIPIATFWFSSNSSTRVLSLCFYFGILVTTLLNTVPFCCFVYFLFPLSAKTAKSNSINAKNLQ